MPKANESLYIAAASEYKVWDATALTANEPSMLRTIGTVAIIIFMLLFALTLGVGLHRLLAL